MPVTERVLVVGGGLVGPVAALLLARRGYQVALHERHADPATTPPRRGRSVHLVLSERGWRTLRLLGLDALVRPVGVPLSGRAIHRWEGPVASQPYARDGATIFCVDRSRLHATLVAAAAAHPAIAVHWGSRAVALDLDRSRVAVRDDRDPADADPRWIAYDRLLAADGAFSAIRGALQAGRFDHQQSWLDLGYRELHLPAAADGGPSLDPTRFHVWPRNRFFLTAFPNPDGTFTGSLFLPWRGTPSFASVQTAEEFHSLVASFFPDLLPVAPRLWPQFRDHPASGLLTVRCAPWSRDGRVLLLGDAAHAVVPFFGQGMNCGFEDVRILGEMLDRHADDWPAAMADYEGERRPNVQALSEMSVAHYEHLNHVPDALDAVRERIGEALDRLVPERFRPLYELVAFTSMPYATAQRLEALRQATIAALVADPAFHGRWPDDADARIVARVLPADEAR